MSAANGIVNLLNGLDIIPYSAKIELMIIRLVDSFKGAFNSLGSKFVSFVSVPLLVNYTIMCQYLRQEIKRKRTLILTKIFSSLSLSRSCP